jgi:hypothetical protein
LDSTQPIVSQGVQTGDLLVVHEHKAIGHPEIRITTFEAKTLSILKEVLKINDSYFHTLEISRSGEKLYERLLEVGETDPWDEFAPPDDTVIGAPGLSTEPLPGLLEDESENEEDDVEEPGRVQFETIEEAAEFFWENPWNRWAW